MIRSTELWLMSRSCQSATFLQRCDGVAPNDTGDAAQPFPVIGLRLCGIAELPFWPAAKNSSASRTSVRWRCRNSTPSDQQSPQ